MSTIVERSSVVVCLHFYSQQVGEHGGSVQNVQASNLQSYCVSISKTNKKSMGYIPMK